jgi:diphosphomevalonate decarboxylase
MINTNNKPKMELVADLVTHLIGDHYHLDSINEPVTAFAPSNIALAKYWGKRNTRLNLPLNLPMNDSVSISLGDRGATAILGILTQGFLDKHSHQIKINQQILDFNTTHGKRLSEFLDLFRSPKNYYYDLDLTVNLPIAAGVASSACIFAAIVLALNQLHRWELRPEQLSILARLGSGSACRSIYTGFSHWRMGSDEDGLDSFAVGIETRWPSLMVGLNLVETGIKKTSSREGMQRTVETSPLYAAWPAAANQCAQQLLEAIAKKQFARLGQLAEHNAMTMHATMQSAWPPLLYSTEETMRSMRLIWQLRDEGLPVYFTQDAGPNIKILCQVQDVETVTSYFPSIEWVRPFI